MSGGLVLACIAAAAAGAILAALGGFALGCHFANRPAKPASPADGPPEFAAAGAAIEQAGRLCDALAAAATLTERQLASLVERQRRLTDAVARLATAVATARTLGTPAVLQWERSPSEPETELPGRAAFEENLSRLTAAAADRPRGGLLLVSLDRFDKLAERIGPAAASEVRRTVARLLCRTGRDDDLTCAIEPAVFAVLLADPEPEAALSQAAALRDAFRSHPFRLGPGGPEVFVTASFGFAPCLPGDHPRLLADRSEVGVAHSRRLGRNRLHRFDTAAGRFVSVESAEPRGTAPTGGAAPA